MKQLQSMSILLCCFLFLACSSVEYVFRVGDDSFGDNETLQDQGDLPGAPTGDSYETEGEVIATGGTIQLNTPNTDSQLSLIGRDLTDDEAPFSMIMKFESQYAGIPGASSPWVTFTVRDEQGVTGLTFTISGGDVSVENFGAFDELIHPADGSSTEFVGSAWHLVTVTMNFESKQGQLIVGQNAVENSVDFTLPAGFSIAKSLTLDVPDVGSLSHRIRNPVANYLE